MPGPGLRPAQTLAEVYARYLASTRIITGAALVAGWPAILHLAARILRLQFPRPSRFLTLIGLLLGSLSYNITFLPASWIGAAAMLPPACALALFLYLLRLHVRPAIALWFVQGVLVSALAAACLWGLESLAVNQALNPVREVPAILRVARRPPPRGQPLVPRRQDHTFAPLRWPSSGSTWLDRRANRVRIEVALENTSQECLVRLTPWATAVAVAQLQTQDDLAVFPMFAPEPDADYRLTIDPVEARGGTAMVYGLLPLARPESSGPAVSE